MLVQNLTEIMNDLPFYVILMKDVTVDNLQI